MAAPKHNGIGLRPNPNPTPTPSPFPQHDPLGLIELHNSSLNIGDKQLFTVSSITLDNDPVIPTPITGAATGGATADTG